MTLGRYRLAARLVAAGLAATGTMLVAVGVRPDRPPRPPASAMQWRPSPVLTALPSPAAPESPGAAGLARSVPLRLDIPAIRVHTRLITLGLEKDRSIEVPPLTGGAPAGWYRNLASPGEPGTAVILGHVDSARDGPEVFFRLGALRAGDVVSVARADGATAVFTVTDVVEYPKSAFPTETVYGPADRPALRLITCGGEFDHARRSYRANIVVYATLRRADTRPSG